MNIANAHGWEILSPIAFAARWSGDAGTESLTLQLPPDTPPHLAPASMFGQGVLTFHVQGLFRTSPGWDLFVTGSPNSAKDAIAPLSAMVETDWSPYSFTLNWRFTRKDTWIQFEEGEPIGFIFPVQRGAISQFTPRFAPIESNAELKADFELWQAQRQAPAPRDDAPPEQAERRNSYRHGVDPRGQARVNDHQNKLELEQFRPAMTDTYKNDPPAAAATSTIETQAGRSPMVAAAPNDTELALRKRNWLLDVQEAHQHLSTERAAIPRYEGLTSEEFLNDFYAAQRPVVIGGEMDWPARRLWTPEYLAAKLGSVAIEYQGDRDSDPDFELRMHDHKRQAPFNQFMAEITQPGAGNRAYMTANNSAQNQAAIAPLYDDLSYPDQVLTGKEGMMWIGPAGTFTPLHHDLTNNLIGQVVGRKQLILAPAADTAKLRNRIHVFSEILDLQAAFADLANYPEMATLRAYEVILEPGDFLFVPIGWWHQVRALDFSVTLTYTNFRWRNDWHETYPRQ